MASLSNQLSVLSQAVSVVSAAAGRSVPGASRAAWVTSPQSVSSGTLITVSGLSLAMSAGVLYQLEGVLLVNLNTGAAVRRFGLNFPAMLRARGEIQAPVSALQGGIPSVSAVPVWIPFTGDSASGSIIVSAISIGRVSNIVGYRGVFKVSASGTMHILAGGSSPNGVVTVVEGSFIKLLRIN